MDGLHDPWGPVARAERIRRATIAAYVALLSVWTALFASTYGPSARRAIRFSDQARPSYRPEWYDDRLVILGWTTAVVSTALLSLDLWRAARHYRDTWEPRSPLHRRGVIGVRCVAGTLAADLVVAPLIFDARWTFRITGFLLGVPLGEFAWSRSSWVRRIVSRY